MKIIPYGHQEIDRVDVREVTKVLKSDWITQGPKIPAFEKALCRYTGAKYAVVVSSGTAALHLACLASGVKNGAEVIITPITFVASANCILYSGGSPVFADIQTDTANIDSDEIKKKITQKTKAIIPVHFAGHPCDLEEIRAIAKKHNLVVIEDACHALGAKYKGAKIGAGKYSDLTVFSFHPVKSITTAEGGAVLTNKRDLYEKLLLLRNHGITKDEKRENSYPGTSYYEKNEHAINYRLTDLQCALGISQLRKIDIFLQRRREIVNIYNRKFSRIKEIILPIEKSYVNSSWHIYYIRLRDFRKKKKIFAKLQRLGLGVQVHYIPIYLHPYYKKLGFKQGLCPKAEEFYQREISLPLYPALNNTQIKTVIKSVFQTFG